MKRNSSAERLVVKPLAAAVAALIASGYGAAGSIIILITWIYYSAQIFLLCGEFTQVYARHRGPGIQPDDNAVRVVKSYVTANRAMSSLSRNDTLRDSRSR